MKKTLVIGMILFLCCAVGFFLLSKNDLTAKSPDGKTMYYTHIDNSRVQIDSDGLYEYTLDSYNRHGKVRTITFTAGKELTEGAYLQLFVAPIRGVTWWQEVEYNELPENVKTIWTQPDAGVWLDQEWLWLS